MDGVVDTIEIQNVVGTTDIDRELDTQELALDLENAFYEPSKNPGVRYPTQDPEATNLIFRTGNIVCTGAQTPEQITESINKTLTALSNLRIDVPDNPPVTINNIVSSASLGAELNLNATVIGLGLENTEYDPEQFPGIVYRIDNPIEAVTMLFSSGNIVITGVTTREDTEAAVEHVVERLGELGLLNT